MIEENLSLVRQRISAAAQRSGRADSDIHLIAVTKTHSAQVVNEAIRLGVTDVGENKVQEFCGKYEQTEAVNWHLIGHLQSNKVKYLIGKVKLIHSVDSVSLMQEIHRRSEMAGVITDILLQVNISGEDSKFGVSPEEVGMLLENAASFSALRVRGLMTVAPKCIVPEKNRRYFAAMNELFRKIKEQQSGNVSMDYLSMGMSGDYEIAIEEGSNMVRVGSAIFGARHYN